MKKDACMYTLYHMLSFILFIVPIFLIYLLPPLSSAPVVADCRIPKRVGQTPTVARSTASQHPYPGIFEPLFAAQVSGPLLKS